MKPLTEEEIVDLREKHYDSIVEKQKDLDMKIQKELALQEEKLRLEEEALYAAQREAHRAAKQRKLLEVMRPRNRDIEQLKILQLINGRASVQASLSQFSAQCLAPSLAHMNSAAVSTEVQNKDYVT